jgi:hypothetical protein
MRDHPTNLQQAFPRERTLACVVGAILFGALVTADYEYRFSSGFDLVGSTLFAAVGSIGLWLWFFSWRRRVIALLVLAFAYIGSYAALSATGGYCWSQSGKLRYNNGTGLAVTDCVLWHPTWLYWESFVNVYGTNTSRGTVVGYFLMPLLQCDRKWFHPTKQVFSDT